MELAITKLVKKIDINYKNGMKEGISTEYYISGEKKLEWAYINDELKGESVEYYKNEEIRNIRNY